MGIFDRKNTTIATTQNQQYDQRQVYDAGGGVVGDGNVQDNSSASLYYTDFSDHSTDGGAFDVIARVADGIADTSRMQTATAERIASRSSDAGNAAFSLAERAQTGAMSFNTDALDRVFDQAQRSSALAYDSSSDALGFAKSTFGDIVGLARSVVGQAGEQASQAAETATGAYQSAADTSSGNKTLIYAGIAVVAIAAVAFAMRARG